MGHVWLIYSFSDRNDPSPSILGVWSTRELAEQERDRLLAAQATQRTYGRDLIEIEEQPLDEPWA